MASKGSADTRVATFTANELVPRFPGSGYMGADTVAGRKTAQDLNR